MKKKITLALSSLAALGALAAPQALADSGTLDLAGQPDEPQVMAPEPEQLPQPEDPIVEETPPADDEPVPTKGDDGQGAKPKKIETGEDEKVTTTTTVGTKTGKGKSTDETCDTAAGGLDFFQGVLGLSLIHGWSNLGTLAGNAYDVLKGGAEAEGCTFGKITTTI